jgi:hypothetical protein
MCKFNSTIIIIINKAGMGEMRNANKIFNSEPLTESDLFKHIRINLDEGIILKVYCTEIRYESCTVIS